MRDEKRAALAFGATAILFIVVTRFYNQPIWKSVAGVAKPTAVAAKTVRTTDLPSPSHFEDFLAVYGEPAVVESSSREKLHPPIATKWLDYEPEHVRVAFVAADTGENPPRREWIAISYMDAAENRPISAESAGLRLTARRK